MNTYSKLNPKYRAILNASRIEGFYRPFSSEPIVWRETSSAAASSSWRIPRALRISSSLFFKGTAPKWKVRFTFLRIPQSGKNVKSTFHYLWEFFM
jgi:hypothetical protein